jgi:hypothetical protein
VIYHALKETSDLSSNAIMTEFTGIARYILTYPAVPNLNCVVVIVGIISILYSRTDAVLTAGIIVELKYFSDNMQPIWASRIMKNTCGFGQSRTRVSFMARFSVLYVQIGFIHHPGLSRIPRAQSRWLQS